MGLKSQCHFLCMGNKVTACKNYLYQFIIHPNLEGRHMPIRDGNGTRGYRRVVSKSASWRKRSCCGFDCIYSSARLRSSSSFAGSDTSNLGAPASFGLKRKYLKPCLVLSRVIVWCSSSEVVTCCSISAGWESDVAKERLMT